MLRDEALALWRKQRVLTTEQAFQRIELTTERQLIALSLYPDAASLERLTQALVSCHGWDGAAQAFCRCVPSTPAGYMVVASTPAVVEVTGVRESTSGMSHTGTGWQLVVPQKESVAPENASVLFELDGDAWRRLLPEENTFQPGEAYWLYLFPGAIPI